MRQYKFKIHWGAICLITVLSLVMYGCGGGGSSSSEPETETPPTDDGDGDGGETPPEASVELNGLSVPDREYMIDAGGYEDVGEGEGEVTLSCSEAADCAFTVAADGTVTETSGVVTAAQSAGAVQAIAARMEADRLAMEEAAKVAATKAAGTKRMAIAAEAAQTTDAGLGGTLADGVTESTYSMTIERDSDGTTIKIEDSDLVGEDEPKFTQAEDFGGGTTMHVRTMEANDDSEVVEEVVIVTTDIKAPKATAFATVYPLDTSTTDPADTSEALAVAVTAEVAALVMSSAFTANTDAVLTFAFDDTTTDADEAYETPGTYHGAMGTYRCNGAAACTVTIDETDTATDGDQLGITAATGDWIFIPNRGVTVDVEDADYLHYGVWLQKTTDEDGVVTYDEVETFADANGIVRTTDADITAPVGAVTGTATYSGGATGVYVNKVVNPDGSEDSATSGHFTADAELTAHFGQTIDDTTTAGVDEAGQIPPNMLNSLSGTINNFLLSNHDQGPGWSVSLEQASIDSTDPTQPHVDDGVAKGGGDNGSYSATFHGSTGDTNTDQPIAVVGEFNANFSNGTVAGAFGANKDD